MAAAALVAILVAGAALTVLIGPPGRLAEGPVVVAPDKTVLVRFELLAPGAHSVALAGSFNGWNDSTTTFTRGAEAGVWTVTVALPPGEYQYLFVVDGQRWIPDPAAHAQVEDEFGQRNSLLVVGPRGVVRS
jgi:1,4-alpha-glucan branching enzyme